MTAQTRATYPDPALKRDGDALRFDEQADGRACRFCGDDKRHYHPLPRATFARIEGEREKCGECDTNVMDPNGYADVGRRRVYGVCSILCARTRIVDGER